MAATMENHMEKDMEYEVITSLMKGDMGIMI